MQETVVGPRDCERTVALKERDSLLEKILILDVDPLIERIFPSEQVRRNDTKTLAIKMPICLLIALPAVKQ